MAENKKKSVKKQTVQKKVVRENTSDEARKLAEAKIARAKALQKAEATKEVEKKIEAPVVEKKETPVIEKIVEVPVVEKQAETPKIEKKVDAPAKVEKADAPIEKKKRVVEAGTDMTFRDEKSSSKASKSKEKARRKEKKDASTRSLLFANSKSAPFNYTEAYKALRTNISFISATEEVNSIVITSAIPKESKSNVSVNLAITLAKSGKNVLLVDCDLRKPVIHRYLRMKHNSLGFTDILSGKADINDCIVHFKDIGINVLPAGTVPPNPSELLSQKKTKKLIDILKNSYDMVIFDAPPICVVTDAAIIGHYVDGAILVVRSKFAATESVQLAKKKLEDVNVRIFGAVLTRYDTKKSEKGSAYSYSYGYGYGDSNE